MFSTVRINQQVFILDKAAGTFEIGVVSEEPKVRFANMSQNYQPYDYNHPMTYQVVDLKVQTASGVQNLIGLPMDKNVFDNQAKTLFVTEDKAIMLNELRVLKGQSENHIKQNAYHQEMIGKYEMWIDSLSPEDAERKRNEAKIANLENKIVEQQEMNRQLIDQIKTLMNKLDGANKNKNKEL